MPPTAARSGQRSQRHPPRRLRWGWRRHSASQCTCRAGRPSASPSWLPLLRSSSTPALWIGLRWRSASSSACSQRSMQPGSRAWVVGSSCSVAPSHTPSARAAGDGAAALAGCQVASARRRASECHQRRRQHGPQARARAPSKHGRLGPARAVAHIQATRRRLPRPPIHSSDAPRGPVCRGNCRGHHAPRSRPARHLFSALTQCRRHSNTTTHEARGSWCSSTAAPGGRGSHSLLCAFGKLWKAR
jgi:hypothetical protein